MHIWRQHRLGVAMRPLFELKIFVGSIDCGSFDSRSREDFVNDELNWVISGGVNCNAGQQRYGTLCRLMTAAIRKWKWLHLTLVKPWFSCGCHSLVDGLVWLQSWTGSYIQYPTPHPVGAMPTST